MGGLPRSCLAGLEVRCFGGESVLTGELLPVMEGPPFAGVLAETGALAASC